MLLTFIYLPFVIKIFVCLFLSGRFTQVLLDVQLGILTNFLCFPISMRSILLMSWVGSDLVLCKFMVISTSSSIIVIGFLWVFSK